MEAQVIFNRERKLQRLRVGSEIPYSYIHACDKELNEQRCTANVEYEVASQGDVAAGRIQDGGGAMVVGYRPFKEVDTSRNDRALHERELGSA